MGTRARHFRYLSRAENLRISFLVAGFALFSLPLYAFSPKAHVYIGLKIIDELKANPDSIELEGVLFPADAEACNAITKWPGYFLSGTIGPDAYPDMAYGQSLIHPDLRCDYSKNLRDGDCAPDATEISWVDDWLQHLWTMAHKEPAGPAREQALAFVLGFFSHAAGDMWCHTFVNQYAGGSWPSEFISGDSRDIVIRHIITEGIIDNHTPDVKKRIWSFGNPGGIKLRAPIPFLKRAFVDDDWAIAHAKGTFIGNFAAFRKRLLAMQPAEPKVDEQWISRIMQNPLAVAEAPNTAKDWLMHGYIKCWAGKIDEGLEQWLQTSSEIAIDLVDKNSHRIWEDELRPFMHDHAARMLVKDPVNLMSACISLPDIPGWIFVVLNPVDFLNEQVNNIKNQTADILKPLNAMVDQSFDPLFRASFGMSYDEFAKYCTSAETYAPNFIGEVNTLEILLLLDIQRRGQLNDETCAVVYNAIVTNKLILLNSENLDRLLGHYGVGNLYSGHETRPNVMLGFMKSLDGNHQWRKHAPSANLNEPGRSFGMGMPLWTDCAAREHFFIKVFKDWENRGVSVVYADDSEPCL